MSQLATLGDASVTADDLALLVPPAWLNDRLISFWLEHLRLHVLVDDPRVAVLLPNLVFFLALTDDKQELEQIVRVHDLHNRHLIILPVNDSLQTDVSPSSTPSGTHWTLLVYERPTNTCYYLDSIPNAPVTTTAQVLAARLDFLAATHRATFVRLPVQRQTNTYDCGACVCVNAQHVVQHFIECGGVAGISKTLLATTTEHVDMTRQEIGRVVSRLVDERQNSTNSSSPI